MAVDCRAPTFATTASFTTRAPVPLVGGFEQQPNLNALNEQNFVSLRVSNLSLERLDKIMIEFCVK